MSEGNSRVRLSIVGVIVMALFSALFARLWFLQVGASPTAEATATSNRIRVIQEPAIRGRILDAKGRVLVGNRVADAITFDRSARVKAEDRKAVVGRLAELLGVSPKLIQKTIDDPRIAAFAPVPVAVDVPLDKVAFIREHKEDFPGVDADRLTIREYPNGRLASHVLGYTGEVNADELRVLRGEGYRQGDTIGKAGVEQMFESELRGRPRVQKLEVDSRGRVVSVLEDLAAVPGKDVQLTIDIDIQRIAEESLAQGMEGARDIRDIPEEDEENPQFETFRAGGGSVIVLNPNDGSVVAMASAPDFDPAAFTSGGVPAETLEEFESKDSNFPLLNRAVQGTYAPGSTFKLMTSLAGLDTKLITPDETVNDTGCLTVAELEFCNAGKKEHGTVDLPNALTVSSDVYFYEIGRDLWELYRDEVIEAGGPAKRGYSIQETAAEFGFGTATGVGLGGEASGRIPDQDFKEDFNRTNPDLEERRVSSLWLPGDSVILAVGQGDLLVTPIQLANAYATFANGGNRYTPRLASALLEPRTGDETAPAEIVQELAPQPVGEVDIKPEIRDAIMLGLAGVVGSGLGTANDAFEGFSGAAAGKTGTAEVVGKQDTSLFVGINPPEDPQYVTLAIVEEGGFGSAVAAPIVRRIIEALGGNLNPEPVRVRPPQAESED
ncbi:MAG: penicillin-binding protein 2 [Actinobacteria bacterium]|nr:penicillin-binding protein 2 [Actinomycetota bacterium]